MKNDTFCLSPLSLTLRENKLERLQIVIISGFDIIYRVRPEAYDNAVKHCKVASRKKYDGYKHSSLFGRNISY